MPSTTPLKADLHVHTDHSKDSRAGPGSIIDRAMELGFDAIAVTDHNTVSGSLEAERLARGRPLTIIPGQEVHTQQGEIIVLNIRETLPNQMPALDTVKLARRLGGFVIVPHPFDIMRKGLGKSINPLLSHIHAVEVFNSRTIFGIFNSRAYSFARENNLPMTVGSDTHFPEEMGSSYMIIHSSRDIPSMLDAVLSGNTELVMRGQALPHRIRRGLLKIRTYF